MKEELVEGIRQAISKGEPIEKAMMSFYNSGYSKQDIEEAAAAIQSPGFFQQMPQPVQQVISPVSQQPMQKTQVTQVQQPIQQIMAVPQPQIMIQPGVVQRVSAYGPRPNKKGMAITIILVVILLFLVGILTAVILFKDEISDFLSSI